MVQFSKEELYDLYWNKGLSTRKIAKLYGTTHKKVQYWMRKYGIPRRESYNPKCKRWWKPKRCPELAYVIGVVVGDGSASIGSGVVSLEVTDREFAEAFREAIEKLGLHSWTRQKKNRRWITKCTKVEFAEFLKQFKENPEKILEWVQTEEEIRAFLRGFYDSEGWIHLSSRGNIQFYIGNSNCILIRIVKEYFKKLDIESRVCVQREAGEEVKLPDGRIIITDKPEYRLKITRKESTKKFLELVGSNIPRKLPNKKVYRRAVLKRIKRKIRDKYLRAGATN